MLVNGSSIQGIFKYGDNYTFEKGDLVVGSNNVLYYVNYPEIQGIDPANDEGYKYYIPYSRIQTATSIDQIIDGNKELLVTNSLLAQYFTNLIGGIGADGSIDIMDYNSAEIALMKDNQIHYIRQAEGLINVEVGAELDQFPLAGKDFLLRVYRTRENEGSYVVIQEVIDFLEGRFFYRYARTNDNESAPSWSNYRYVGTSSDDANLLNNRFNTYQSLIDQVLSKINTIQENLNNFYSFYEVDKDDDNIGIFFTNNNNAPTITFTTNFLNEKGSIIIAFLSYTTDADENKLTYKESIYINPFSSGIVVTEKFYVDIVHTTAIESGEKVPVRTEIRFNKNQGTNNLKIDKIIVSLLSSLNIKTEI